MSKQNFDVCVIGGGIIGLCCAYYLQKEGKSVIVLDKGPIEKASSHGNCGYISPSHIVPLNDWSLILKSLKWIFKEDAPFRIKPRFDLDLLKWFVGFARRANSTHIERAMAGRNALLKSSDTLYKSLFEDENIACNYRTDGIFWVFKEEHGFHHFNKENDMVKPYGLEAKPFVGQALIDKEPALKEDLFGGWLFEMDSWVKPDDVISGLVSVLKNKGVQFVSDYELKYLNIEGDKVTSVSNGQETYSADDFVLSMGAWTPLITKQLNLSVPVVPGKGYSLTMKPPKNMLKHACIFQESKVAATPWKDTFRLGSLMEFAGYDENFSRVRLNALKKGEEAYLKTPYSEEVLEEWFGYRPMSVDGLPIIGKSPKHKNLFVATGHSMIGLSMGTGTGKLISELVTKKGVHLDASFYGMERFG